MSAVGTQMKNMNMYLKILFSATKRANRLEFSMVRWKNVVIALVCGLFCLSSLQSQNELWKTPKHIASGARWSSPLLVDDSGSTVFCVDSNAQHPHILALDVRRGNQMLALDLDSLKNALGLAEYEWKGHFQIQSDTIEIFYQRSDTRDSTYHLARVLGKWNAASYVVVEERSWPLTPLLTYKCVGRTSDSCFVFRSATIGAVQRNSGRGSYTEYTYTLRLSLYRDKSDTWQNFLYMRQGEYTYNTAFVEDVYYNQTLTTLHGKLICPPFVIQSYNSDVALNLAQDDSDYWLPQSSVSGCFSRDSLWLIILGRSIYIGPGSDHLRPFQRSINAETAHPTLLASATHQVVMSYPIANAGYISRYDYVLQRTIDTLVSNTSSHCRSLVAAHDSILIVHDNNTIQAFAINVTQTGVVRRTSNITRRAYPCSTPTTLDTIFFNNNTCAEGPEFTYYWDFGDGHSSEQRSPRHQYTASGTKQVRCVCRSMLDSSIISSSTDVVIMDGYAIRHKQTDTLHCSVRVPFTFFVAPFQGKWCGAIVKIVAEFTHKDTTFRLEVNSDIVNERLILHHAGQYKVSLYEYANGSAVDSNIHCSIIQCVGTPPYVNALWTLWWNKPVRALCLTKAESIVLSDDSSRLFFSTHTATPLFQVVAEQPDPGTSTLALARKDSGFQEWTYPDAKRRTYDAVAVLRRQDTMKLVFPQNEYTNGYTYWGSTKFDWSRSQEYSARIVEPDGESMCVRRFIQTVDRNPHFPPPYTYSTSYATWSRDSSKLDFIRVEEGYDDRVKYTGHDFLQVDSTIYFTRLMPSQPSMGRYQLSRLNIHTEQIDSIDILTSTVLSFDARSRSVLYSDGRCSIAGVLSRHRLGSLRLLEAFADQNYVLTVVDTLGNNKGQSFESLVRVIRLSDGMAIQSVYCMSKVRVARISYCSKYYVIAEENGRLSCFATPSEIKPDCYEEQIAEHKEKQETIAFPNPAFNETSMPVHVQREGSMLLSIYSSGGLLVARHDLGHVSVGTRVVPINLSELAVGYWLAVCQVGSDIYYSRFVKVEE